MRYSVTAIMLRYILALLHNALGLCRKVIASKSYRFWQIEAVIATPFSYRFGNILTVIAFKSYCSASKAKAMTCNAVTFCSNVADLCSKVKELRRLTKNALLLVYPIAATRSRLLAASREGQCPDC